MTAEERVRCSGEWAEEDGKRRRRRRKETASCARTVTSAPQNRRQEPESQVSNFGLFLSV